MAATKTQILMANIRIYKLEADFEAGSVIYERVSKKSSFNISDLEFSKLCEQVIQDYIIEQKRKTYRNDFEALVGK